MFHDYLQAHRSEDRRASINLFRVLDQKPKQRDRYLDKDLAAFPYVNGGLFADEDIEIPRLGDAIIDLLLTRASEEFGWSAITTASMITNDAAPCEYEGLMHGAIALFPATMLL